MNANEAYNRLISEGCNTLRFFVHNRGNSSDAIGLVHSGKEWNVFYTERGCDSPPSFTSKSESDAAEYFYKTVKKDEHLHLVGFFKSEENANILENELKSVEIVPIRNDIPNHSFTGDKRYRVFVSGADIFPTRTRIGTQLKTDT